MNDFKPPQIMAIINATPDSFSDGGKYKNLSETVDGALQHVAEGADILDIGGESSRPFSEPVLLEEELSRVIPLIKELRKQTDIPISIDTTKAEIANQAINAGANIINDISGLRFDPKMCKIAAEHNVSVVIMHMLGTPKTMQKAPAYNNIISDILDFFNERINFAISNGIKKEHIILDPGIGFGKTSEHNLTILNNLEKFKTKEHPLLIGLSRKAFLGAITGEKEPSKRDVETVAAVIWTAIKGVNIIRVHNVKQCEKAMQTIRAISTEKVKNGSN